MSHLAGLGLLLVVGIYAVGWSLCRLSARQDAEEAQRELLALLADQARQKDESEIADNLDV